MPKKLTDKQGAFISKYTDAEDPKTFLNGTQAYLASHPGANAVTARNNAARDLKKSYIRNRVQEVLEELGFGVDSRLQMARDIAHGDVTHEKQVVTKNGSIVTINVYPDFSHRLRALEIANKMDGTYSQQQLEKELARDEARALQKNLINRLMKNVTPTKQANTVVDDE